MEIERLDKKLFNPGFVAKAPQKVVDEEREKKANYEKQLANVEHVYANL